MNKQDVYETVSVKDEKPYDDESYFVLCKLSPDGVLFQQLAKYYGQNWSCETRVMRVYYWLKPLKQVYVLTEDELADIYKAGYKEMR